MHISKPKETHAEQPFKRCPRCAYSLRGLPANHACPECGLAYDADSEWYRVTKPKQVFVVGLVHIFAGLQFLPHMRHLFNFAGAATWERFMVLLGVVWLAVLVVQFWFWYRSYLRGIGVAITCDGLLIRMPAFYDGMVAWDVITGASIANQPTSKPHVAVVKINDRRRKFFKQIQLGRLDALFPRRADVERFVDQINVRIEASRTDEEDSGLA